MTNLNELQNELKHFTGTEQFYKNPLYPLFVYTDGIKYLAEKAEAYWLIDYIFSQQQLPKIANEPFQVWQMTVENNQAVVRVEDGNKNLLGQFNIEFTDFPLAEIELWYTDRTLMLPTEY